MINLDCDYTDAADLWAFWETHRWARKASRLQLCGRLGKGTEKATRAFANYAANKATAMQCRDRGDVVAAQVYESICERIYQDIPQEFRW